MPRNTSRFAGAREHNLKRFESIYVCCGIRGNKRPMTATTDVITNSTTAASCQLFLKSIGCGYFGIHCASARFHPPPNAL
jgi:hypothetical protein